jgi:hypothetical protein
VNDLGDPGRGVASSRISHERFVEEMGLILESMNLPRMSGRVLGAILLGPGDGPTAADLAAILQASKGSISNTTQLLIHYRFIERTARAGDRRDRFVMKPGAWTRMALWRLEFLQKMQELAGEGLGLLGPDGNPQPLLEVRNMYGRLDRQLPRLLAGWGAEDDTIRGETRG